MSFLTFNVSTIKPLLNELKSDIKPIWGSMTANEMLAHLIVVVDVSIGLNKAKQISFDEKLSKNRWFLMSEHPMPKEFKAEGIDGFTAGDSSNLEILKETFIHKCDVFHEHFNGQTDKTEIHALFGPLNYVEWQQLHSKHCTHHFRQFGLVSE